MKSGVAALIALLVGGCSMEPGYPRTGAHTYFCYNETPGVEMAIEFRERSAIVTGNEGPVTLEFVESMWPRFVDRYRGSGYALEIDPEAFLTMPDGRKRGPCQG